MKRVVAHVSEDDIIAISAYLWLSRLAASAVGITPSARN
jgi:hypothetical protein